MASLPLVERDLRIALRKLNPRQRRMRTAAWAVLIIVFLLASASVTGGRHSGGTVHTVLLMFGLAAMTSVPARVAGAIADERRNGTLGLLFVSGLSAMDIFVGKLFSAAFLAFNELLALFPLLALPFVMGGVSFELFLATVCCLPNLLLFILAASLFASTVTKEEASAQSLTTVIILLVCGLPLAVWFGQKWLAGPAILSSCVNFSPAYGVYLVFTRFSAGSAHVFWLNSLATLGWSVALLLGAAGLLQRIWRRDESAVHVPAGRTSRRRFLNAIFDRQREASRWLLECNPALWTELADTKPLKLAWFSLSAVVVLWLAGWALWRAQWLGPANFYLTVTVLLTIVRSIQNHTTARRFAVARRDGAFELLLTTPLSAAEIVEGHMEGRRLQFRSVLFFLVTLEAIFMVTGLLLRPWTPSALVTYFAVWAVLGIWTWNLRDGDASVRVAWTALNSAQVTYAMRGNKIGWWWYLWCAVNISRGFGAGKFPSGDEGEFLIVFIILFAVWASAVIKQREAKAQITRLIIEFREIIREPIPDPHDRRFAHWKPWTERFPWGTAGFQDQVIERNARRRAENFRRPR